MLMLTLKQSCEKEVKKKIYTIFQMASTQQILMILLRVNTSHILKAYTLFVFFNSSFINIAGFTKLKGKVLNMINIYMIKIGFMKLFL